MSALLLILFLSLSLFLPAQALARVTPNDLYQTRRAEYQNNLLKITDPAKRQLVEKADSLLNEINQKVCARFDADIARMAAILEEEKSRQGVTETVVAFGQGDTLLDTAAYQINFAAEAIAFQKMQDYTPQIGSGNPVKAVTASLSNLKSNLNTLRTKINRAKAETKKALDRYEK